MTGAAENVPAGREAGGEPARYALRPGSGDVLVLRALGLGDALTGVAPLRGVRRAWPDRRLVLAGPAGVGSWLADLGVVDAVLPTGGLGPGWLADAATWPGAHVAVNLHGRGPESHRLLRATRPVELVAFGCAEAGHEGPAWRVEEHEVERWCRLLRHAGGDCGPEDLRLPLGVLDDDGSHTDVVLHPGAASAARRWPADRWAELARRLTAAGRSVVVSGSAEESVLCARVAAAAPGARSVAGTVDLAGLAGLIGPAGLLVCGDTGVAHLATALGTPSVLLFGPTPPRWWGPTVDVERHTVLWRGDAPGDPHADRVDPALASITVEEVWETVLGQLAREPVRRCG